MKHSGSGSGSGKYALYHTHKGRRSVEVQDLPEDIASVRIVIREMDIENKLMMDEDHAYLLWASLDQMAKNKGWLNELELPPMSPGEGLR